MTTGTNPISTTADIDIAARLKQARDAHGYTQAQVAAAIGTSLSAYNLMENGRRPLKADAIISICNFYKTAPDWLLGFTEAPTESIVSAEALEIAEKFDALDSADKVAAERYIDFLAACTTQAAAASASHPASVSPAAMELAERFDKLSPADKPKLKSFLGYLDTPGHCA